MRLHQTGAPSRTLTNPSMRRQRRHRRLFTRTMWFCSAKDEEKTWTSIILDVVRTCERLWCRPCVMLSSGTISLQLPPHYLLLRSWRDYRCYVCTITSHHITSSFFLWLFPKGLCYIKQSGCNWAIKGNKNKNSQSVSKNENSNEFGVMQHLIRDTG